jgi:hypothetical protein
VIVLGQQTDPSSFPVFRPIFVVVDLVTLMWPNA